MSSQKTTPIASGGKKKRLLLSLNDLERVKLSIPPGSLPPGIAICLVVTDSGIQVGYMEMKDAPPLYPLADLARMNGIERIVGSSESVDNRSRQGDMVKIVSKRLSALDQPNFGPAGPKNVGDAIGLATAFKGNKENISRNTAIAKGSRDTKKLLLEATEMVAGVLHDYVAHQAGSGGMKKTYKEFCEESHLPYWLFTRLTTKGWITDTPQESLTSLIFPKNVSKGIALRVSEWDKPEITKWLDPILRSSTLIRKMIKEKDLITGTTVNERTSRDEESFKNLTIPVMPPWTLHDNAVLRRSANPVTNREGVWAPFHAMLGRLFLTSVGNGPRNITPKTFWETIAGFKIDLKALEAPLAQYAESDPPKGTPFRDLLMTGAYSPWLASIALGLDQADPRTAPFFEGVVVCQEPVLLAPGAAMPQTPQYDDFIGKVIVTSEEDRVYNTITLVLTDDEKKLLVDERWILPASKQKDRRFPLGDAPTASASQLLAAIRPRTRKEEDRHFSGLYATLTDLLSSFNHPRVTNRAVALIRASMTRLKKEGLFFSSDALTGQGGELVSLTDEQLFEDL